MATESREPLPSTRRTISLLVRATAAADPGRAIAAAGLTILGQCWPLLAAAGVARAVDAAADGRGVGTAAAIIGVAVLVRLIGSPPLATVIYTLRERAAARVERRIVELTCALPGIDHLEQPELLNRIAILQANAGQVGYAIEGGLTAVATVVQLAFTAALLVSVHLVAAVLPLAGLLPFGAGLVKNHLRAELDRESGHFWRAKKGLRILAWAPEHGPDLRLGGAGETVWARQDEAVLGLRAAHDRWAITGGFAQAVGDIGFGVALVGVVAFVAHRVASRHAPPGDLLLAIVLGQRLAAQIGAAIEQLTNMLHLVRSLAVLTWLEDEAGLDGSSGGVEPPAVLSDGVSFRGVAFAYANNDVEVLHDINLDLQAGQRVALVGENGAGKTTLVSLLCGFHDPTAGAITVDGVPLAAIDQRSWQARVTAVFQESARLEVELIDSVGVGDLDHDVAVASAPRVTVAIDDAGLHERVESFPDGLDTRLGRLFPDGQELSGGEWQKVAHARSALRRDPLVLVLDEPTAALDAQAEHDLFQRIRHRPGAEGAITLFVSHRFSTVRDADLIVVLDHGRIVERGSHAELMAIDGTYADLYRRQARHYV